METVYQTNLDGLKMPYQLRRGKVRDIYEFEDSLLFIATDRISAFDVVMGEPIPEKGKTLSQISALWFEKTGHITDNHLITTDISEYPEELQKFRSQLEGRSMLVKKCKPLAIECIVRGFVAGSGWKEYKKSGTITGIKLPEGLQEFSRLEEPIYTPSTKAETGHDENISYEKSLEITGKEIGEKAKKLSLELYKFGAKYLEERGIIIADTKFEFGIDENGGLILIDEALTPDSSRFWDKKEYAPGKPQLNFDKQILRDYLETTGWDKTPPPPALPDEIIRKTTEKYLQAKKLITES